MAKAKTLKQQNQTENTMKKDITVTIKTLDHNGDSLLERKIDEAIQEAAKKHFNFGMWPFVGTDYFQFKATSMDDTAAFLEDCAALYNKLAEMEQPLIVLTPDLQGGIKGA
jgi:hypothetical protein